VISPKEKKHGIMNSNFKFSSTSFDCFRMTMKYNRCPKAGFRLIEEIFMGEKGFSRRDFLCTAGLLTGVMAYPGLLTAQISSRRRPNFVVFMIDDLGYGDIGCYGGSIHTPNIDRLAGSGLRFTDFHSNGPMCSPTRAAFMTGCYQSRFGREFESALGGSSGTSGDGLPLEAVTIAEVLRKANYATGMFGKWHLGYNPPLTPVNQGFDEYRGMVTGGGDHHTHIDRSGNKDWWHNDRIEMEKGYTATLLTDHSVDFIEKHKAGPFFLYLAHLAIHFPWQGPDDPPHRTEGKSWHKDKWGIISNEKNVRPHVEAMIKSVDESVKRVMDALENNGLADNTLVVFMSDNGGYIHYGHRFENISSNGPLRGQKGQVYEGGHRVPCIAYWPGRIDGGRTTDETVMTMDFFPTISKLAGASLPVKQKTDGVDLSGLLLKGRPIENRSVFWRKGNAKAVRKGPWKLVSHGENAELYNLARDIGEKTDLAGAKPQKTKELKEALAVWQKQVGSGYKILGMKDWHSTNQY
jgi:arylsulfatase A-like enzyme